MDFTGSIEEIQAQIEQVKQEKIKCEGKIKNALSEFCLRTGLAVYDVGVLTHYEVGCKNMLIDTVKIDVRID